MTKVLFLLLLTWIIPAAFTLALSSPSTTASFTRFLPHAAPRTRGAIQYYLQQHYNVSSPTQIKQHNAFASTLCYEIQFTVIEWNYLTVQLQIHVEETCADGCFVRIQFEPAWTQRCVQQALQDVENGILATPRLLRRQMLLPYATANVTAHTWKQFCWNQGGGLPLPLPPLVGQQTRIILPPGLVERILSMTHQEIYYQVDNPGWFSLYPVYTHVGRIRLLPRRKNPRTATPDALLLDWQVQVRPYPYTRRWVQWFTETIVVTLSRNFYVHCSEPNALVNVLAPTGRSGAFWTLRKDSWIGGVVEAQRMDRRVLWKQMLDLWRPWTWGRSYDLPQTNASTTWSDSFLQD